MSAAIAPAHGAPLSIAEIERRFRAASKYRMLGRTIHADPPIVEPATYWRQIERVTSTGVYVTGTPYPVTRLRGTGAQWFATIDPYVVRAEYPAQTNAVALSIGYEIYPGDDDEMEGRK